MSYGNSRSQRSRSQGTGIPIRLLIAGAIALFSIVSYYSIGNMVNMKYGRDDELESDKWGVQLAAEAGYDPRSMLDVMRILEEASGGGGPPEMMSTHPKPANRQAYIKEVIESVFPNGLPSGLRK